jgi:hypothetical protein
MSGGAHATYSRVPREADACFKRASEGAGKHVSAVYTGMPGNDGEFDHVPECRIQAGAAEWPLTRHPSAGIHGPGPSRDGDLAFRNPGAASAIHITTRGNT